MSKCNITTIYCGRRRFFQNYIFMYPIITAFVHGLFTKKPSKRAAFRSDPCCVSFNFTPVFDRYEYTIPYCIYIHRNWSHAGEIGRPFRVARCAVCYVVYCVARRPDGSFAASSAMCPARICLYISVACDAFRRVDRTDRNLRIRQVRTALRTERLASSLSGEAVSAGKAAGATNPSIR